VLEQNMLYGTGTGAHIPNHTDAGKTGTTDSFADAWFSGYTPRLQATVWIGYPGGEIPMTNVHGIAVSGPTFPAQIWHLFMETAIGSRPDVPFAKPKTSPQWTVWRGQYQYSGSYYTGGSSSTGPAPVTTRKSTTAATHTTQQTTAPSTTTAAPPPPSPTTTVEQPVPPPPTDTTQQQP
jgi:penicillin-binding protein 1A